jgi:hypothetical protein
MLTHFWFDFACGFYALSGGALVRYLWNCRTPIDASIRRLRIPEPDKAAVWSLSDGSDVGIV